MTLGDLQTWLNVHGASLVVDGKPGPATCAAIVAVFTNRAAKAVTDDDIAALADRLGVSTMQVNAVAQVESRGAGFDKLGRPKILFERHQFHRLSGGRYSVTGFSNAKGGGYNESSWEKLTQAACRDVDAAFAATSWGKFQVMGYHWRSFGFASPIELAYSTVGGEAAHYDLLCRFVEANSLQDEMRVLSAVEATCRPFAKAYNGVGYEQNNYDGKLAEAMR